MYQFNSERVPIKKSSTHSNTCGIAENIDDIKKRNFARFIKALDRHHLSQGILVALDEFVEFIQASLMPFLSNRLEKISSSSYHMKSVNF